MQEKNPHHLANNPSNEAQIEKLIRLGGERDEIDQERRERVRKHLLELWSQQHKIIPHKKKIWRQPWALVASTLSFCLALFLMNLTDKKEIVATVTSTYGLNSTYNELLKSGNNFYSGQEINTASTMLELRWQGKGVLKFDQQTRVHFIDKNQINLISGAIYFDSKDGSNIQIYTSHGVISDIGTQFEARSAPDNLSVYVREGKVKLDNGDKDPLFISSGKALQLKKGITTISDMDRGSEHWLWADAMEGSINLDNHNMLEVLEWLARREAWQLKFKTDIDKQHAINDLLHGKFKTNNSKDLLEQLALISDMRYQINNNILLVSYP